MRLGSIWCLFIHFRFGELEASAVRRCSVRVNIRRVCALRNAAETPASTRRVVSISAVRDINVGVSRARHLTLSSMTTNNNQRGTGPCRICHDNRCWYLCCWTRIAVWARHRPRARPSWRWSCRHSAPWTGCRLSDCWFCRSLPSFPCVIAKGKSRRPLDRAMDTPPPSPAELSSASCVTLLHGALRPTHTQMQLLHVCIRCCLVASLAPSSRLARNRNGNRNMSRMSSLRRAKPKQRLASLGWVSQTGVCRQSKAKSRGICVAAKVRSPICPRLIGAQANRMPNRASVPLAREIVQSSPRSGRIWGKKMR
ncbi:hypothetical protein B0T16DRAFT_66314 [Cercophora newfieldiana]|uniref:Secreted protein n=1 Tax=Cercophora newfieldiana TaxID=92897 RepID=A0AA39YS79_9PEZI|nr:hypothetical protein B0T16DRAFT_66314 [Cercophora newfieldiana]